MTTFALELSGITKFFGSVLANNGITLKVSKGTIHGLVGENGAGKSTLMSILYGLHQPDDGQIKVRGTEVRIRSTHDAIKNGIGMVHQHFALVETLTAVENVMLGAEGSTMIMKATSLANAKLDNLMTRSGLRIDLNAKVENLSVGDRQRIEILKVLFRDAEIIILDEPTAVLTPQETSQLFSVLRRLKAEGKTLILITHKLKEVMALCDEVSVMRSGKMVLNEWIDDTDAEKIAASMIGRKHIPTKVDSSRKAKARNPALAIKNLSLTDSLGVPRLSDIAFEIYPGEILGVAGVAGNGQSELLETLSGLRTPSSGELNALGQTFKAKAWLTPAEARNIGIAHVPEDRHARGLLLAFSAWENAILGYEGDEKISPLGWLRKSYTQNLAKTAMTKFDVRPANPFLSGHQFSGGNQQKLILAREFGHEPKILFVGQPTRGVDIGAIEFIHTQMRLIRDMGCAILLVSSELDEILALSDRIIVMNRGRTSSSLDIDECDEIGIGRLMADGTAR